MNRCYHQTPAPVRPIRHNSTKSAVPLPWQLYLLPLSALRFLWLLYSMNIVSWLRPLWCPRCLSGSGPLRRLYHHRFYRLLSGSLLRHGYSREHPYIPLHPVSHIHPVPHEITPSPAPLPALLPSLPLHRLISHRL